VRRAGFFGAVIVALAWFAPAAWARAPIDGRAFPDKVVALTWDDGPDRNTLELARYLHAHRIAATFFVVGRWHAASAEPGVGKGVYETGVESIPILNELVRLGHRIENHTLNHAILTAENVRAQLMENQRLIDAHVTPQVTPQVTHPLRLFRAPGGVWDSATGDAVDKDEALRGMVGPIAWDIDRKDWENSRYCRSERPQVECERAGLPDGELRVKPAVTAHRYVDAIVAAGHGIVLLHDRVGHVGSRYAVDVARILIPELLGRGFVFAPPVLEFGELRKTDGVDFTKSDVIAFGDINGDGRNDVCGRSGAGVRCALSTGRSFTDPTTWLASGLDASTTIRLVDVNGDGRADLCARGALGTSCALAP
jgi:peptidoglycan/xylan/chitin deacetylase (PgdA/CDA1 family)